MLTFRSPGSTRLQLQAWLATLPVPVGQTVQAARRQPAIRRQDSPGQASNSRVSKRVESE